MILKEEEISIIHCKIELQEYWICWNGGIEKYERRKIGYPRVRACFATIVTFVIGPLIEFFPEGLSLPRSQFRFQFWIKLIDHVRPYPEQIAEMPVMSQNWFQSGRVAKQIELLVSFRYFRRAHRLLPMLHFLSSCPSCFRVSLSLPATKQHYFLFIKR